MTDGREHEASAPSLLPILNTALFMDRSFVTTAWILSGIYTLVEMCVVFPLSVMPLHPLHILHNQFTAFERLSSQVQPGFNRVEEGFQLKMFFISHQPPQIKLNPPPPQPPSCFPEDHAGENSGSKSTAHAYSALGFFLPEFFFL